MRICRFFVACSAVLFAPLAVECVNQAWADAPGSSQSASKVDSPVAAEDTLEHFDLAPGLRIELAACEPQVIDPVAIRFDEHGRMWVVEMRDYPHGPAEGEEPLSRISILEDRDGDGRFETANVFADNLLFVTGVQPWKGGAFVTLAGRVDYMKDTTGDGKADQIETWYTGFAQENTQLRANHPRLALDNHIYIANGLRGGTVVDARDPGSKPVSISGMDFRFDPLTGDFEAVSGVGQFGLTFDDSGNRFVCSNRNPLNHIVIEDRYLKKNPLAAIPAVSHDVATSGADSRIYPIARAWTTSNLHAGQFTAACGVHIYRGNALPKEFHGNAFTCDPTGYLVHREILQPMGATFTSKPARDGVEFLASRDEWFRPVNIETGPDGALYVVDMYRAVIEHPQFMPTELKTRPDLLLGNDRGRIYRIVSADQEPRATLDLSKHTGQDLIGVLEHPNTWHRETAARLLLQSQNHSLRESLRKIAAAGDSAQARAHALWLLRGLGVDTEDDVRAALRDKAVHVRRQALILAERWLNEGDGLFDAVLALAMDSSPAVRFQTALTLAPLPSAKPEISRPFSNIVSKGLDDPWTRRAVAIASGEHAGALGSLFVLDPVLASHPGGRALFAELNAAAGRSRDEERLIATLELLSVDHGEDLARVQRLALTAFGASLLSQRKTIWMYGDKLNPEVSPNLSLHFVRAAEVARDNRLSDDLRLEAIDLLELKDDSEVLREIAAGDKSQAARAAAISAMRKSTPIEPWKGLVDGFGSESPAIRGPIIDGLLARTERTTLLLDAIESGRIKPSELDSTRTNRLLNHGDAAIKNRAKQLLASAIPADRQQVLADYQVALKLESDPQRGRGIFRKSCSSCHQVGDVGVNVAPDISDSRTKLPQQILTDVLQPNRAIDANYVGYIVRTVDGRVLTGILTSETATSITLKQQEGKVETLLRADIEEMRSTGVSLMPEGLEKNIPHQDMADLISFIKNWRYLDGRTPLGKGDE